MDGLNKGERFQHEAVKVFQMRTLTGTKKAEKAQLLAQKHKITVTILAKSGENYTTNPKRDPFKRESEQMKPYTSAVPEGMVYMQITKYGNGDLHDFWGDMDAS